MKLWRRISLLSCLAVRFLPLSLSFLSPKLLIETWPRSALSLSVHSGVSQEIKFRTTSSNLAVSFVMTPPMQYEVAFQPVKFVGGFVPPAGDTDPACIITHLNSRWKWL